MEDICSQFLADNDVNKFVSDTTFCINRPAYKHEYTNDLLIRCQWVITHAETSNLRIVRQQAKLIYNECISNSKVFLKRSLKITKEELDDVDNGWAFGKHYE